MRMCVLFVIEAMRFTEEDEWVWERVRGLNSRCSCRQQGRSRVPEG